MDRQILSQEEIDTLLKDTDNTGTIELTPIQMDALGEIGNISYSAAAIALSELLNQHVNIDTPSLFLTNQRELMAQHPAPFVLIQIQYKAGLSGSNILILKVNDVAIIADLMMGGDGTNPKTELGNIELSAVGEAMNQMIGNAATSLSKLFSRRVDIAPPKFEMINLSQENAIVVPDFGAEEQMVVISFKLRIGTLSDNTVMLIIPSQVAIEMADTIIGQAGGTEIAVASSTPRISQPITSKVPVYSMPIPMAPPEAVQPKVMVQPAQFTPFGNAKPYQEAGNIGLILDVPLQVTVELGSTRMKIKDILELGLGSIIELDKLAGEPVDIYVNSKLIAKGEVVVIDENFGIRISEIISPIERAQTLQ